jgi:hypothetical protein
VTAIFLGERRSRAANDDRRGIPAQTGISRHLATGGARTLAATGDSRVIPVRAGISRHRATGGVRTSAGIQCLCSLWSLHRYRGAILKDPGFSLSRQRHVPSSCVPVIPVSRSEDRDPMSFRFRYGHIVGIADRDDGA